MESCSRLRALSRAQPLSGETELVRCGVRAFVFVGRFHGRCFCQRFGDRRQYSTSATSQKVRVQADRPYKTVHEATFIVCIPAQSFTYRPRAHTTTIMSSPKLSPQADSGCQQQTAQPPDALALGLVSRPPLTAYVRVQSLPTLGQPAYDVSDSCEHFAECCTSTYHWERISAAEAQSLIALNIHSQVVVLRGVPSDSFPSNDVEPEQGYDFKISKYNSQMA